jgi:hypothetical protein
MAQPALGPNAPIYANLFDEEDGGGSSAARGGRENRVRHTPRCPARHQWAGFCEEGQPYPCRSANGNCAEISEYLTPGQGRQNLT